MARVKLKFPEQNPLFTATIPVRTGDLNYANHVGNDAILSIIHEARMQLLCNSGFTELNAGGHGMIMADVMIAYKGESFYGDILTVEVFAEELTAFSFDLLYRITTVRSGSTVPVAHAKTGMVCFDYTARQIVNISAGLRQALMGHNHW